MRRRPRKTVSGGDDMEGDQVTCLTPRGQLSIYKLFYKRIKRGYKLSGRPTKSRIAPLWISDGELLALSCRVPKVKALVDAATGAADYMLDADLCDANKEWRLGDGLRAALAPFKAPE